MDKGSGAGRIRTLISAATVAGGPTFAPYVASLNWTIINANTIRVQTTRGHQDWVSPKPLDDGEWHHVVYTRYASNKGLIGLDGLSLGEKLPYYWDFLGSRNIHFCFGNVLNRDPIYVVPNGNASFAGRMDRVRFYNRRLQNTEILALSRQDVDNGFI